MYIRIVLAAFLALASTGLMASVPAVDLGPGLLVQLESRQVFLVNSGDDPRYASPSFDDSSWKAVPVAGGATGYIPTEKKVGWYRLHLRFPSEPFPYALGVRFGAVYAADEVWFNGVRIGGGGGAGGRGDSSCDKERLYEIPPQLIRQGADNLLSMRVLRLESSASSGLRGGFSIGSFSHLQREFLLSELPDICFVLVLALFAVYFLVSFLFRGRNSYFLYFSLFCLFFGAYVLLRTGFVCRFGNGSLWIRKAEFIMLPVQSLLLAEFVRAYFSRKRNILHRIWYPAVACLVFALVGAGEISRLVSVHRYINEPALAIPFILIGMVLVRESAKKNRQALVMGLLFAVIVVCMSADVMTEWNILALPRLGKYAIFLLLVSFAVIIEHRAISIRTELEDIRQHLESKVRSRTNELNDANERLQAFNRHISDLNDQYHQDFYLAVRVQKALTPLPFGNEYWRIAVRFQPTGAISGDFYDIYKIRGGALGVIVADAAGHGVAAALITMIAKPVFMHAVKRYGATNMKAVMETANSEFLDDIGDINEFLSAQAVRLDADSVTFVNAGHPPAVLCGGGRMREFYSSGSYLGMPELVTPYAQETEPVSAGDILLMFSDALIEAKNSEGKEFGLAKIREILAAGYASPDDLVTALTEAVYQYTGTRRLRDDLTIVACQRRHDPIREEGALAEKPDPAV